MRNKRRRGRRFVQLHHSLLKSQAWHSLTPLQRCGYVEIAQLYDGTNNGRLAMSARRLAGLVPCNKDSRILQELEDAGLIDCIKVGRYTRKDEARTASEYRLTDFRCDVTGELPSRRYNERKRWEPCEIKPKRKAMTDAERAKRYRKRHAERMNESDGSVPVSGTVAVTQLKQPETDRRETAKNVVHIDPTITLSVRPNHTLIHLTRGTDHLGTPQENSRKKTIVGSNVVPLSALPPGHDLCKTAKVKSLPRGWHWCKQEQRVVTDTGIVVPIVDDRLVGTAEQRNAARVLRSGKQQTEAQLKKVRPKSDTRGG